MDTITLSKEIISKITEEQVLSIMKDLGAIPFRIKPKEIWFQTICHGGDSHKLCYFREGKDFYCYTNCGKMSLFKLVSNVKGIPFYKSVYYVAKYTNVSTRKIGFRTEQFNLCSKEIAQMEAIQEYKNKKRNKNNKPFNPTPIPVLHTNIMNFFEEVYYLGWIREGITIESMEKFGIKWYEQRKHIIIPHLNYNGDLVGIRRRTLNEEEIEHAKYMPETIENITYAHALGLNWYGLYQNKEAIQRSKTAIITEGEKSVLLSDSYFGKDSIAIATCGFSVSNWQCDMLEKLGVQKIYLAFDKDFDSLEFEDDFGNYKNQDSKDFKEYLRYYNKILKTGEKLSSFAKVEVLWDRQNLLKLKDSPFDKGKEVLGQLMKTAIPIIL